jgi:ABC-type transporter Mla MlaB component
MIIPRLTFDEVVGYCQTIDEAPLPSEISFAALMQCDTAALVFVLHVLRRAERENIAVKFTHIPAKLKNLITLYHMGSIIPQ